MSFAIQVRAAGIAVIGNSAPARKNGRIATAGVAPMYSSCLDTRLAAAPLGRPAVVDGRPGAVVAVGDRVLAVVAFTIDRDRVTEMDLLVDPDRLRHVRM
jgi:hypothetical protein